MKSHTVLLQRRPQRLAQKTRRKRRNSPSASEQPTFPIGVHDWSGHTRAGLRWEVHRGDTIEMLKTFTAERFQCVVTSPPYFWQRDYNVEGQIGLEKEIDGYTNKIIACMEEVKRVLKKDGVLFLNLGDTYYSAKGMPRGADRKNKAEPALWSTSCGRERTWRPQEDVVRSAVANCLRNGFEGLDLESAYHLATT